MGGKLGLRPDPIWMCWSCGEEGVPHHPGSRAPTSRAGLHPNVTPIPNNPSGECTAPCPLRTPHLYLGRIWGAVHAPWSSKGVKTPVKSNQNKGNEPKGKVEFPVYLRLQPRPERGPPSAAPP